MGEDEEHEICLDLYDTAFIVSFFGCFGYSGVRVLLFVWFRPWVGALHRGSWRYIATLHIVGTNTGHTARKRWDT